MSLLFQETTSGIARGIGPEYSPLMIVGSYPSLEEVSRGLAFVGTPERFLDTIFATHGVKTKQFYRTYYCKKLLKLTKKERSARQGLFVIERLYKNNNFLDELLAEIKMIGPNVILALGEEALQILTDEKNIRNFQGSILNFAGRHYDKVGKIGIKVVPIYSVNDLYQEYSAIPHTSTFIKRALKYQNDPKPFEEKHLLWICKDFHSLCNYLDRNQNPEYIVVDIETAFGFITCLSICTDGYEAVSIPLLDSCVSLIDQAMMWKALSAYFAKQKVVNQNVAFDAHHCRKWGIAFGQVLDCTMLLANTVYPELPKRLGFQTAIHTELQYYKDEGKEFDARVHNKDRLYIYNAKDSLSDHQIYESLKTDARELNVWDFYQRGPQKFLNIYRKITDYGVRVDESRRTVLKAKYEALLQTYYQNLKNLIGDEINYNSTKQVGVLLYEDMKLPKRQHRTPKGELAWSTDEDTLTDMVVNTLKDVREKQVVNTILYCRKLARVLQILDCYVHPDKRLRTTWNPHGTDSGRTSTTFHYDRYYYLNDKGRVTYEDMGFPLQTFSKHGFEFDDGTVIRSDLRSIFVPSPGYTFVSGDSSQAEARIVALLAEDYELLESFDCRDVHIWTAAFILRKPESAVTKDDREKKGKRPRHAGNYDMSFKKLAQITRLPYGEAQIALDRFHEFSPRIRGVFHDGIREIVTRQRYMINSFGRRRDFLDRLSDSLFRVAYSWIPQSTVSDNTKFAMLYSWDEMPAPDCFFLGEFHDGLFAEVKIGLEERWFDIVASHMEKPIDFKKCSMPRNYMLKIPLECETGENWAELKKVKRK